MKNGAFVTIAHAQRDQLFAAERFVFAREITKPLAHGLRIGGKQLVRNAMVDFPRVAIIGLVKAQNAVGIDTNIGKTERKRAGGAALMQAHFPALRTVDFRLTLVVSDKTACIADHNNRRRLGRRIEVGQFTQPLTGRRR